MNKVNLLKKRATEFRTLLREHEETNEEAMLLLKWLSPLFNNIEAGKIDPPKHYEFGNALGRDSSFYEPNEPFHRVEADFVAALEDWESQDWYKKMSRQ